MSTKVSLHSFITKDRVRVAYVRVLTITGRTITSQSVLPSRFTG